MSLTKRQLEREFDAVRRNFFPRWDRNRDWKPRMVRDPYGASGRCRPDTKTIEVSPSTPLEGDNGLTMLLIHEIAHAVTPHGHGRSWQRRMEKAAQRAEALGRPDLAEQLRAEFGEGLRVHSAPMIYSEITDTIRENDRMEFEELISYLAHLHGSSPEEYKESFPRCRAVYDKAIKEREEEEKRTAEFRALLRRD